MKWLAELIMLVSVASIVTGVALISLPGAFIVGGVCLMCYSVMVAYAANLGKGKDK
jgi:hypothetical protein